MVQIKEDMTGWKMSEHGVPDSRLTVIKRVADRKRANGSYEAMWLCECSCSEHKQIIVPGWRLKCKHKPAKSCGCLRIERARQASFIGNKHDLSGKYGVLWETNSNQEVYFDLKDADEILKHTWCDDGRGYSVATINGKVISMHVFLGYKYHDHANKNKKDNRSENLRKCTPQENARNQSKQENRSSRYIGVSRWKEKWRAYITVNDKQIHLGVFDTENEALVARLKAEKKYFKEFATQKDLFGIYKVD